MSASWNESSHGVEWAVELERDVLLPGRLVGGRVSATASDRFEARSLVVAFVATEWWQHEETSTDAEGHTTTRTVTSRRELVREPVQVSGPITLNAGETRTFDVQLPVPPLGPASLDATVAGVSWALEAKLDRPGWPDSRIEAPVRVAQPIALLRAGVVHVGEFALYPEADAGDPGLTASIALDPLPLVAGSPFRGTATIRSDDTRSLQEIRAEIRVAVKATVASGLSQVITPWAAVLVGPTEVSGEHRLEFEGALPDVALPTIELPHGRAGATIHLILATAWARDPHLVRDITIATTAEL
ncbi:MAG TPA: hypothetical protein VFJ71_05755 [Candidatus Limnocylindrales bacterium]|nr:hypothetical protein [Candidatus Limnocylindrales bacterium]